MPTITQIILSLFLIFALSRVYLRFRSGELRFFGMVFWIIIFLFGMIVVNFPIVATQLAQLLGIGRGVDAIVYTAIALLFYLVFRLHIFIEDIRNDISDIVSKIALQERREKDEKRSSKN